MDLWREPLPGGPEPVEAARWLAGDQRPVALIGAWAGGGALLTSDPIRVADVGEDPFALLDGDPPGSRGQTPHPPADPGHVPVGAGPGDAVGGGWFGWLGYRLGPELEALTPAPPRPVALPAFDLAYHDHLVRCDPDGQWWFEALVTPDREAALQAALTRWGKRLASTPPPPRAWSAGPLRAAPPGTAGHRSAVAETVERIAAGELSQANICLRFDAAFDGDPLALWLGAVAASAPAYAGFVGGAGHAIASLSPELFLRRRGRTVTTRPIKGTAPAACDPAALAASEKDRAENVMIADLMRNDLGRVCRYGSVSVPALCIPEAAPGVWHLVSEVTGELRADVGDGALLRATFPPGSVTGAPKVQAMGLIHQLEASAREAYCGALGFASPAAGLELNVAIRTLELSGSRLWLGAGGGIVADSDPDAELAEAVTKVRGVAEAAGLSVAVSPLPSHAGHEAVRSAGIVRPALGTGRAPRPDPAAGLIETLLVRNGRPVHVEAHLARLRASCAALGFDCPPELEDLVWAAAAEVARAADLAEAALRVRLRPAAELEVTTRPLPAPGPVALTPIVVPGGLGAHKWADRSLIDAHSAPGQVPLIVDLDGVVLEAGHAGVIMVSGDELVAAPPDGRILPSLSRARALASAAAAGHTVRTESFSLADLLDADAVVLTSSLRGPHLGLLSGVPPSPRAAATVARLAAAISAGEVSAR